jgi:LPS-assembly protein
MISRIRFLITAALLCHVLLAPPLVTSQLHSPASAPVPRGEEVTIRALHQEKDGPIFKMHGQCEIHYRNMVLWADDATYNSDTGDVVLEGHVILDGGPNDEHIQASHGTYNVQSETGRFYNVIGTIGVRPRVRRYVLTSSNPFAFTGKEVDKTGPDHYIVHDGTVTSCKLPHPKWQFNAHRVVMELGHNAVLYRSTFLVGGKVPVFFFPVATHPLEHLPRQSGFLIPSFGTSSIKGTTFGDSFFWAINRSMDATLGVEYFSSRGWAQHGEFRARPSETSFVDVNYFGVIDRGVGTPKVNEGGEDLRVRAEAKLPHNFRGVADIDYLSSFLFRLVFNEVFTQAIASEVKSQAFMSNTTRGFSYNGAVQRYQNFESTTKGDVITILHAPSFEFSSVDRPYKESPFYWNLDTAVDALSRSEPAVQGPSGTETAFRTAPLVGRFDFAPNLSLPLHFRGWALRPELGVRETIYSEQLVPSNLVGTASTEPIDRRAIEASVELRPPTLERIFERGLFGRKLKHTVEPRVIYRRVAGVDDFSDILRFDERDILSDTNEVEYGVVNRIYSKKKDSKQQNCIAQPIVLETPLPRNPELAPWEQEPRQTPLPPCQPAAPGRELIRWELAQKYFLDPNFGGALVSGRRNVFTTTADFTAIAFLTGPRHLSPLISRLRIDPLPHLEGGWDLDYDFTTSRINASTILLSLRFGQLGITGSDAYLQAPGEAVVSNNIPSQALFHQFHATVSYGGANKRGFSGTAMLSFDEHVGFLQYTLAQTTYNWDCCGVTVEFRRFALGTVRNENQYKFTFSLANIASFGNLRRQERLF